MQFDECLVVAIWQLHLLEFAPKPRRTANFVECGAVVVGQFSRRIWRKRAGQQSASKTSDSKPRWFFGGEDKQLNRMRWTKSTLPQRTYRFQASQHSNNAIVFPCVRNGVDVRARTDNRRGRVRAIPTCESISDGILTHRESSFLATRFQPRTSLEVRRCKNNSCHGRSV